MRLHFCSSGPIKSKYNIYALQFDHATSRLATGDQDCAVKPRCRIFDLLVASKERDVYSCSCVASSLRPWRAGPADVLDERT